MNDQERYYKMNVFQINHSKINFEELNRLGYVSYLVRVEGTIIEVYAKDLAELNNYMKVRYGNDVYYTLL